jgi:hypothetical protein
MPRKLDPAFLDEVRTLATKGYNQTQIAKKLRTNQPRISYIMRKHAIPTEDYAATRKRVLGQGAGAVRVYVFIEMDGKTLKEQRDATPEQLHALATYLEGLQEQAAALYDQRTPILQE